MVGLSVNQDYVYRLARSATDIKIVQMVKMKRNVNPRQKVLLKVVQQHIILVKTQDYVFLENGYVMESKIVQRVTMKKIVI